MKLVKGYLVVQWSVYLPVFILDGSFGGLVFMFLIINI